MDKNKIYDLNINRLKVQLSKIQKEIKTGDASAIKQCEFLVDNHVISSSEIDFTKDCVFICDLDFLGIMGLFGLLKLNKVKLNDPSLIAASSQISTSYMTVNSTEAKYVRLDDEYSSVEEIPESFRPSNFISYDLVLWRLVLDAGLGKDDTMFRVTKSLIEDRYYRNKLNWIFFLGKYEDFVSKYNISTPLNVYHIRLKSKMGGKGGTLF